MKFAAILVAAIMLSPPVFGATGKKFSDFPEATTLDGTEIFLFEKGDSSTNNKITAGNFKVFGSNIVGAISVDSANLGSVVVTNLYANLINSTNYYASNLVGTVTADVIGTIASTNIGTLGTNNFSGVPTTGYVPSVQADGTVAWASVPKMTLAGGIVNSTINTTARYVNLVGGSSAQTAEATVSQTASRNLTITNLYMKVAVTLAQQYTNVTATLMTNGVATDYTATLIGDGAITTCSNTVSSFTIQSGWTYSLKIIGNNTTGFGPWVSWWAELLY